MDTNRMKGAKDDAALNLSRAHALAAAKVRKAGTSFYWGMRILPPLQRRAVFALYAFCREVDDIGDIDADAHPGSTGSDNPTRGQSLAELQGWRQEIEDIYRAKERHGILAALADAVHQFGLPVKDLLAVIDGVMMDVRTCIRAPGLDELELYCRRVAGAVGLLSSAIFGERSAKGRDHALALGLAFQLTNILRDLDEDAVLGRLYLPREYLFAHNIWDTHPHTVLADPAIGAVCVDLAGRAEDSFAEAARLSLECDRYALRGAFVMRDIYHSLLRKMEKRGWTSPSRQIRARVGRREKIGFALRHWFFAPPG